ncbi:MAG: hypothetical protein HF967_02145, partial [Methanosarcinales archaeon]|nr:hypothetical protein [Methanosarcinales archaeon]
QLTYDNISGASYTWYYPNGDSATIREPLLTSVQLTDTGNYYLVINVHNCFSDTVSTTTVNVSNGPAVTITSVVNPTTCGATDGSITIGGLDATHTYRSFLNGVNTPVGNMPPTITTYTYNNLDADSYTIIIEDLTTSCFSVAIDTNLVDPASPPAPVSITSNSPICVGNNIDLTTPLVLGATYNWSGPFVGSPQTTTTPTITIANGITGSYCVSLTSSFGCTGPTTCTNVIVNPVPTIQVIGFVHPTTCVPGNEGSITINGLTSGTSYDFVVTGPTCGDTSFTATASSASYTFASLCEGNYSITAEVTGLTCLSNTVLQTLTGPTMPSAPTVGSNSPVCEGDDINLTATGGGVGATYAWTSTPVGFTSSMQNPTILNASASDAKTYNVITTVNGCVSPSSNTVVVVNDTTALTLDASTDPTTCNPGNEGTITIGGLTNGQQYTVFGVTGYSNITASGTTFTFTNLFAGTYNISVTTSPQGCGSNVVSVTLNIATNPTTPTPTSNSPVCEGGNINLSYSANPGATYAWTGPGFTSTLQNPIIIGVDTTNSGQYCVTVTEGGCVSLPGCVDVVVNENPTIVLGNVIDPTTCSLGCDGTIQFTDLNPGQSYQYGGSFVGYFTADGSGEYIETGICSGSYSFFVSDTATGCISNTLSATLVDPATPAAPTISSNSPVCVGDDLQLNSNTVTGATYAWTGPLAFTSSDQNPVRASMTTAMAGTYNCTVSVNGCVSAVSSLVVTVNTAPVISITATTDPTSCIADPFTGLFDGSITIESLVSGVTYTVISTGPTALPSSIIPFGTSYTFIELAAGCYQIIISENGCQSNAVDTCLLSPTPPPAPSISNDGPVCEGNDIHLTASTVGGASYTWTHNGATFPGGNTQNPTISNATVSDAGTYCVSINVAGCVSNDTCMDVVVNEMPTLSILTFTNPTTCTPGNEGTITIDGLTGGSTYTIDIDGNTSSITPAGSTYMITGLDAGNHCVFVTTDSSCVSNAVCQTLTGPTMPVAPVPSNDGPVCEGGNVQLSVTPVAGATYAWTGNCIGSPDDTLQNPLLTNVDVACSGFYQVTVTVNGCTSVAGQTNVIVNPSDSIWITATTDPTACGATDGTITIDGLTIGLIYDAPIGTAGSSSYTYTGLVAGPHSFFATVTATHCVSNLVDTSLVDPNAPNTPNLITNSPICEGATLLLSTDSINPAYTYIFTGSGGFSSSGSSSSVIRSGATPSMSGQYCLTVEMAGCVSAATCEDVVVNPKPIISELSHTDPTICGAPCDGIIVIDGLTANDTFTLTVNGGNSQIIPTSATYSIEDLCAGTYTISVTSNEGCVSDPISVTLNDPATPSAPIVSNDGPVCIGGDIQLTAFGPANGSYQWTGGNLSFPEDTLQNPLLINVTSSDAGIYSVTVTVNGCESPAAQTTVVINTADTISISAVTDPSACMATDGTITIDGLSAGNYTVLGGITPTAFSSVGATYAFTGLDAGPYTISVQNADGCISNIVDTSLVDPGSPAAPNAVNLGPVCEGENITIFTDSIGDTYEWTLNGTVVNTNQSFTITNTTVANSGDYCVTITTAGCTSPATCTSVVINPLPVISEVTHTDPTTCIPGNDGTITIDGLVADSTYTLTTNGGTSTSSIVPTSNTYTITDLEEGNYIINVTTNAGCQSNSISVTLTNPALPNAPTVSNDGPACEGDDVQLTATGVGTFAWTSTTGYTNAMQNPILYNVSLADAGTYFVTVTVNGCQSDSAQTIVTINDADTISITATTDPTACLTADGTITIDGLSPGAYITLGGLPNFTATGTTYTFTGLTAGSYSISVQNVDGCISNVVTASLVDPGSPNAPNINQNGPLCEGEDLVLSTDSTNALYSYNWTGPNTSTLPSFTTSNIDVTDAGQYCLTVELAGCISMATCVDVVINPTPTISEVSHTDPTSCDPDSCDGTFVLDGLTANDTFTLFINGNSSQIIPTSSIYTIEDLCEGTYTIYVETSSACQSNSISVTLTNPALPSAPTVSNDGPVCEGGDIQLTASGTGDFSWTSTTGYTSSMQNPILSGVTLSDAGIYTVTVTVNGCESLPAQTTVVVNSADTISITSVTDPTACTVCDGTITIDGLTAGNYTVLGGITPTSFSTVGATYQFTALCAGAYSISVQNANGCISNQVDTSLVDPGSPAAPNAVNLGPVCEGENITIYTDSIGDTYEWTLDGTVVNTNQSFTITNTTVANSGDYCVTTTTAGCTSPATCTNVVINPLPVISEVTHTDPTTCNPGNDGTITIDGLVADSTYTLTTNGGTSTSSIVPTSNTYTITDLEEGNYIINVTTNVGCQSNSISVTLTEPALPSAPTVTNNGPACEGDDIQLTATGTGSFLWTGPCISSPNDTLQNPILTNVTASCSGIYTVTVTVNGCESLPSQTTVVVNSADTISITAVTDPTSCAASDGTITIDGLQAGTYTVLGGLPSPINPAGSTFTFTVLNAGSYIISVENASGCTSNQVDTSLVDPGAPMAPNAYNNGPVCEGTDIVLTTDSVGDTYEWKDFNGVTVGTTQSVTLTGTLASMTGTYCVTVTTAGCTSPATCTEVVIDAIPVISEVTHTDPTTCNPGNDGTITIDGLVADST